MADIFISYAREDRDRVIQIEKAIEEQGWSMFWDWKSIPVGKTWRQFIKKGLEEARCILVLWSEKSIDSEWVIEEADHGKINRMLVPARIDDVRPPIGFGQIQAANLINWTSDIENSELKKLVEAIESILGPSPKHVRETEQRAEEERKQKQDEKRKREEEERRKEEEGRRLEEEQKRIDAERKAEEERKQKEAEAKLKADEEERRREREELPKKPKEDLERIVTEASRRKTIEERILEQSTTIEHFELVGALSTRRSLALPIMLISIGWAIGWAIGWYLGPIVSIAIIGDISGSKGWTLITVAIIGAINGGIGGLATVTALRLTVPIINMYLNFITTSWAIGWAIGLPVGWAITGYIGMVIGGAISGGIGGLATVTALRLTVPVIQLNRVFVTIGWAIGWVIGLSVGRAIAGFIGMVISGAIIGVIGGVIGGGVMFLLFAHAKNSCN